MTTPVVADELWHGSKDGQNGDPEERIAHVSHQSDERLVSSEWVSGLNHDAHSQEDESEFEYYRSLLSDAVPPGEEG